MNWYSEWTLQLIYFIGLIPRVRLGPAGGRQICLPCFWVGPPSLFLKALEMTSLTTGAMSPLRQSFHANFSSQIRSTSTELGTAEEVGIFKQNFLIMIQFQNILWHHCTPHDFNHCANTPHAWDWTHRAAAAHMGPVRHNGPRV